MPSLINDTETIPTNGSIHETTNGTAHATTNGATNGASTLINGSIQEDLPVRTTGPSVKRYPESGISILVVGAGVGGLLAALECWRKGHDVRVLEKSKTEIMTGL